MLEQPSPSWLKVIKMVSFQVSAEIVLIPGHGLVSHANLGMCGKTLVH